MIGKNDLYCKKIKMSNIFKNQIINEINKARKSVGINLLYIDCVPELTEYYKNLGFSVLKSDENDSPLVKMIMRV